MVVVVVGKSWTPGCVWQGMVAVFFNKMRDVTEGYLQRSADSWAGKLLATGKMAHGDGGMGWGCLTEKETEQNSTEARELTARNRAKVGTW